jgi:hypothetical protein
MLGYVNRLLLLLSCCFGRCCCCCCISRCVVTDLFRGTKRKGRSKDSTTLGKPVIVVAVAITTIAVITVITCTFVIVILNKHVHNIFNNIV